MDENNRLSVRITGEQSDSRANGGAGVVGVGVSAVDDEPVPPPVHSCAICNAEFRTKSGLGVHVVRAHPTEANAAIAVARIRRPWDPEKVRLLARAEADAICSQGNMFMNQHLLSVFPYQTLEAIKGKRRQPEYRRLVQEFCQLGPHVVGSPTMAGENRA